jgi:hypothetical protein
MLRSWAYVPGPGCSSRWRPRLGPRLERTQALCGPCVSRRGLSPSVCGRRSRAELHIQDIGPRMLPSSAALRRGASCSHPCCSFPCSALRAHGTLHSPVRGKHLRVLCATNPEVRQIDAYIIKGRRGGWGERRPFCEWIVPGRGPAPYPSARLVSLALYEAQHLLSLPNPQLQAINVSFKGANLSLLLCGSVEPH